MKSSRHLYSIFQSQFLAEDRSSKLAKAKVGHLEKSLASYTQLFKLYETNDIGEG